MRRAQGPVVLVLLVTLLVTSAAKQALGAAFGLTDNDWQGASALVQTLRTELGPDHVVVLSTLHWQQLQSEDGLLVVHPQHALNPDELSTFLRAGGRVALLDDYGASDQNLTRFQIERVDAPLRPLRSLRNNPALAIAEPVSDSTAGHPIGVHPVVAGVSQLVTNHPRALVHPNLTPVLQIPARDAPPAILAVAGQVGKGRLFVVADSSVLINQMMRYPGNRAFAQGLGRYLLDDDSWGYRRGKLYVLANSFEESGAFGNESSLAKTLGAAVREAARMLSDAHQQGLPSPAGPILGVLAAAVAALWLAAVAARAYRRLPPRFARSVPLVAQGGIAGRAAVLAAPSTHRALALLELKSAFEEALATRFELELPVGSHVLLEQIENARVLDERSLHALKKMLFMMAMVENSVAAGRPVRVRERDIQHAASSIQKVLAALDLVPEPSTAPHRS